MSWFCGRIEADPEAVEPEKMFVPVYLTGAAEWSMDRAAAFVGTRAECKALRDLQPLPCLLVAVEGTTTGAKGAKDSGDVYAATCERLGEHEHE